MVIPGFKAGNKLGALWLMLRTIVTPAPAVDRWESERGYPLLAEPVLAHDSEEWLTTAKQTRLALLNPEPARGSV